MTYSLICFVALIVQFIIGYDVLFKRDGVEKMAGYRTYKAFLITTIVYYAVDACWGLFFNNGLITLTKIDTYIYFITMALIVFFWTRYVVDYLQDKNKAFNESLLWFGWLIILVGATLLVVNAFFPYFFEFKGSSYKGRSGRYLFFSLQVLMFTLTTLYSIISGFKRKGTYRKRHILMAIFGLCMVAAIFAQIYLPLFPMYSAGCIISVALMHRFVWSFEKQDFQKRIKESLKREKEQQEELGSAKILAYSDPLTGVRNKHAFVEFEDKMDVLIRENTAKDFSVIVFDLNNLKSINDTFGHKQGDDYIVESCKMIKEFFPDFIIYRYGGDEFVAYMEDGEHYKNRYQFLEKFNKAIEKNVGSNGPVIAIGFSEYIPSKDNTFRAVFTRADDKMYARKRMLKQMSAKDVEKNNVVSARNAVNFSSRWNMYEMFYLSDSTSLIEMLNSSNCDEILEVDLYRDTYKQFYHIDGKYFVPTVDFSYRDLHDFTYDHIVHPDDRDVYENLMKLDGFFERLKNSRIPNFDFAHFRYKLQDGDYRYVEQCIIAGEENGLPDGVFRLYIFDINNLKNRQLGKVPNENGVISSNRDSLTGLLSAKPFFIEAEEIVKENKDKKWCLISIDIEHFKFFDEWFGREKGDYLLAKIGAELTEKQSLYEGVAGYFGQDDFTILAKYNMENINKLYEGIREHIISFGLSTGFMPAFGIAIIDEDIALVDAFDRSTIAASRAKNDIRNRICVYSTDMQYAYEQEYRILTDFMHAFKDNEITFYLQPQCRISTGKIVGAESLARWIKKDGEIISPADFIPVLEKYGFITDLDQYLWEEVCKWLRKWIDEGHKPVPISLNISRADIFNIDVDKFFIGVADKYNLPRKLLKLEITESSYTETTSKISELVDKLRKHGFMVLMDDFGSGYSSLNMLGSLRVDGIKLDANFLHIEGKDYDKGIHILESVVNMTKVMGLPMIVEGVETKKQIDFLEDLGCRYVQGFYFYKPMPLSDFEKIIGYESNIDDRGFVVKLNEQFRVREFLDKNIYSDSMLNNVLGPVAIYLWREKEHVDIIRFNQQFYESVGVPDFHERLLNIEQLLSEEDKKKLFETLKEAMNNHLGGASAVFKFARSDGRFSPFRIHFYHLDKKEGGERFYGSATNVTELYDLQDTAHLFAKYSNDNFILIKKVYDKWKYHVVSHGLADVFNLTPSQLEEELNNGRFAHRVINIKELKRFMQNVLTLTKSKENFSQVFEVYDKDRNKVKLKMDFVCVKDIATNYEYIMRSKIIE